MYGLSKTSPIDGSIIDTIVPLLVLLLSVLLGMDRFTRLKLAGLVLGMAGAVAVVLTGGSSSHAHSQLAGNLLVFLTACTTSFYMVWFKRLISRYSIFTVLRWLYCALKSVPATVSSIYTYLQPVLAILLSVWMGLDKLHLDTVFFALVIFLGVGMVLKSYTIQPRHTEPPAANPH